MGLRDATYGGGGGGLTPKSLGHAKYTLAGIRGGGGVTQIEAHTGMEKRLVRALAIEYAIQIKTKNTLAHNNQ